VAHRRLAMSWIGAMLGAYVGFFLARTLGQPMVRHLVPPERLECLMQRLGGYRELCSRRPSSRASHALPKSNKAKGQSNIHRMR
jgi:hypothetical protein